MNKSLLFILLSLIGGLVLTAGSVFIKKTELNYRGSTPIPQTMIVCASIDGGQIDKTDAGFPFRFVSLFNEHCGSSAHAWHPFTLVADIAVYSAIIFGGLQFVRKSA